ncbi:hydroxyacid dehydrogenase [Labilibaculum sp. A4]|uniref:2-hydroxyacid dehydrogenase n=1 Tax=Labilibaculum euxinus TaxID=2686357 RepID=UPI000F6243E7|nr:2-hydroxyacid dehydrogenase [Labilibaculum euxinus]MDQ1772124.1 2-hydroxyacid dehydrogenase [Labilibaculum euxinus]MWN77826.1 hydroxyacid dehydrogenase [Labilibaculum euxinus]
MKVLFIDSTHARLKEMLEEAGFECTYAPEKNKEELLAIFHEFDGFIIRSKFKLNKEELDQATRLKFIGRVGAGLENIDVDYAESKGIRCFNAPEGNRDAVGEHAVGMLLSLFNNLCRCNLEVRNGMWRREENRGIEIKGKTIGIIGYGNMGGAFAQRLKGFGCKVIAYDKYKFDYSDKFCEEKQIEDLFEQCDVLSLHVPQTEETMFMVNDDFLNKFKKPIYLINTARGKVVRIADLVKNLETGKVKGACLDVLEYEKTSFEDLHASELPAEFQYLIESEKVLLSPHVGGWTHESNIKLSEVTAQKIIDEFGE